MRIPGQMLQVYLRNILGQKLGILDPAQIEALLLQQINSTTVSPKMPKIERTPMRLLIGLLLQNPHLVSFITEEIDL